jgi:RHS repeat-associated protein
MEYLMVLKKILLSLALISSNAFALGAESSAASTWVPIANGDITTIIPLPNVSIDSSSIYSSGDGVQITVNGVGATEAFYFRTSDSLTGAKGAWQCSTADSVAANNNIITDNENHASGKYSYEVSACMTGNGCDIPKFTSGNLSCSSYAESNKVEINNVAGTNNRVSATDSTNNYFGSTAAEFRVSESGAATYNVPISIPQGTAGVTPSVSLSYNSQGGDGILGKGWSLNAQTGIARCPKSLVYDGVQAGVTFTKSDRLCMNGQRLLLARASSTQSYTNLDKSVSDSQYWSETARYIQMGDVGAYVRPHYKSHKLKAFTVENKAGETHYYGRPYDINSSATKLTGKKFNFAFYSSNSSSNAIFSGLLSSKTGDTPHTWLLNAIEDVKGNYISYEQSYDKDSGEHNLKSIHYTGTSTTRPYARIDFNYKDNKKVKQGWLAGTPVSMTKLLSSINVSIDNIEHRTYTLGYFESDFVDEKNYLETIKECEGTTCNEVLSFNWQKAKAITASSTTVCSPERIDSELDCWEQPRVDSFKPFSSTKTTLSTTATNANSSFVFDFNGDGYTDIVFPDSGWKVKYGPSYNSTATITNDRNLDNSIELTKIIDFNGDGVMDLMVAKDTSSYVKVLSSQPIPTEVTSCNRGEPGGPWEFEEHCRTHTQNLKTITLNFKATGFASAQVADIDGDGLQDLVRSSGNRVLSRINNGNGFGVESTLIYLPSSQAGPADATYSSSMGNSIFERTAGMKNSAFLDVNGDGKTDILIKQRTTIRQCDSQPFSQPVINASSASTKITSTTLNSAAPISTNGINGGGPECTSTSTSKWYLYTAGNWTTPIQSNFDYSLNKPRAVDLNGDGMSDILWRTGNKVRYMLSNGKSFNSSHVARKLNSSGIESDLLTSSDAEDFSYYFDLSGDGRTDILLSNTNNTRWSTYLSRPLKGNHNQIIFELRGSMAFDKSYNNQFGDVDGDAKMDLITGKSRWYVNKSMHANKLLDVISSVDNGFGVKNHISYTNITNTANNFAQDKVTTYYHSEPTLRYNSDGTLNNNYISPKTGFFVVSRVDSDVTATSTNSVIYQYGGLLLHKKGHGMLGFERLRTIDPQTCGTATQQIRVKLLDDDEVGPIWVYRDVAVTDYNNCMTTETVYHQNFPYIGMPKYTVQSLGVGETAPVLSHSTNTWAHKTSVDKGYLVFLASSTQKSYALNSAKTANVFVNKTDSVTTQDNYGNILTSNTYVNATEAAALVTGNTQVTKLTNKYGSTIEKRLGRLKESKVTKLIGSNNATANTRIASFEYNSEKMLASSEDDTGITSYDYDKWGNKTFTSFKAFDSTNAESNTRSSITKFDGRGRLPISQTNSKGHTNKTLYNNSTANAGKINSVKKTGVNGNFTVTTVGAFGQASKTVAHTNSTNGKTLTEQATYKTLCSSVSCGVSGAFARIITATAGAPEQQVYIDKWGRELVTKVQGFNNTWNVVAKTYNTNGKPKTVSEPGVGNASSNLTTYFYDRLGRVTSEDRPRGSVSVDYNGKVTTTTNVLNNKQRETKNHLGQTTFVESLNSAGGVLTKLGYTYNVDGQLLTAKVYKGAAYSHTQVTNTYNNEGKKETTNDLNKGLWKYTYNGFGELITQENSSKQQSHTSFDNLGRKLAHVDNDGLTCWSYDEDSSHLGKLNNVSYNQGAGQNINGCAGIKNSANYREAYSYRENGLVGNITTTIDGETFQTSQYYDGLNRLKYTTYPDQKFSVEHTYNNLSMPLQVKNATQGHREYNKVYQDIKAVNARGQVTEVIYGNNTKQTKGFDANTGFANSISLFKGTNSLIHGQGFTFDDGGNLLTRSNNFAFGGAAKDFCDKYTYDDLSRVEGRRQYIGRASCSGSSVYQDYNYDALGNIKYKQGTGYYHYAAGSPNKLEHVTSSSSINSNKLYSMVYDARGNITRDKQRVIDYTSYDKPYKITKGANVTHMYYDANRNMYKRIDTRSEGTNTTLYVKGLYERIKTAKGVTEHKYYVGNAVITERSDNTNDTFYLHKDHLGSTTTITNNVGNVVQHINYDPWGKQNRFTTSGSLVGKLMQQSPAESSGYTGHKELSGVGIIHMNGRIYDPTLGRFLQADPHIQAPSNSQSYNRYAYVLNNPLSYTDPSGYFFKKLGKFIKKNWRTIAAIAITAVTGYGVQLFAAFEAYGVAAIIATTGGALAGYVATGSLKGAAIGAVSGAAFFGIGQAFGASSGFFQSGGAGHIGSHALTGGVLADLQGGKFGHGFWSAGITKGAQVSSAIPNDLIGGVISSAVVGGTVSNLTGGKFANGAITAAFQFAINAYVNPRSKAQVQQEKLAVGASSKALGKLLGTKSLDLGIEIDSDGNITGSGGLNLDKLKISLNTNMEATIVGGPDALVGESFKVYDHSAQKAVAEFGIVQLSVSGYDNGVVNFDVQLGAGGYIKYQGGFDLRGWGPAGQYIRAVHQRETYYNSYICKNLPGTKGC